MSDEQAAAILREAHTMIGTAYQDVDCSHFVHRAYKKAGLEYTYASTKTFSSVSEFELVDAPQPGDVVLFDHHMGIWDPAGCETLRTSECKRLGNDAPVLSARSSIGVDYGQSKWFGGTPRYYRWKK